MKNKIALITGITGQDGSYLAELLLKKNYFVHGIIRKTSSINTHRIDHIYQGPFERKKRLYLHYGDMSDGSSINRIINRVKPDEIYNLAAQSHVAVSFDMPEYTFDINANGLIRILETIKSLSKIKKIKLYQASSSELLAFRRLQLNQRPLPFTQRVLMLLLNLLLIGQLLIIESHIIFLHLMEFCLITSLQEEERLL